MALPPPQPAWWPKLETQPGEGRAPPLVSATNKRQDFCTSLSFLDFEARRFEPQLDQVVRRAALMDSCSQRSTSAAGPHCLSTAASHTSNPQTTRYQLHAHRHTCTHSAKHKADSIDVHLQYLHYHTNDPRLSTFTSSTVPSLPSRPRGPAASPPSAIGQH